MLRFPLPTPFQSPLECFFGKRPTDEMIVEALAAAAAHQLPDPSTSGSTGRVLDLGFRSLEVYCRALR